MVKEQYHLEMSVDEISKDPEKFLKILREKVTATKRPLNDVFKAFDENGDGLISYEEFEKAVTSIGIKFEEGVV